jgi:hypothetical protein
MPVFFYLETEHQSFHLAWGHVAVHRFTHPDTELSFEIF